MILRFETSRLRVFEVSNDTDHNYLPNLLILTVELLSTAVVENLPPYFHNIHTVADAERWFQRMVSESRLFVIEQKGTGRGIGFLFAHTGEQQQAHIGYLLGEKYWGQGFASELLQGFIDFAAHEPEWIKLIGGVAPTNTASSKLLSKLGFVAQPTANEPVVFYEYSLVSERYG